MELELPNQAMAAILRAERAKKDWTQEQLAEKSGLNLSTLKRILKGERDINVNQIDALARAFGVTPAKLAADATEELRAMSEVPSTMSELEKKRQEKQAEAQSMSTDQLENETLRAATIDPELDNDEPS